MVVESGGTSPMLLLGALVGLVGLAGLVFVLALGYLRSQSKKQAREEPRTGPHMEPRTERGQSAQPGRISEPEPADVVLPESPQAADQQGEVMRVLRDAERGRVLVQVGGRRYARLREIEDAQVGRRVLWAIADLIRFTGGMAANAQVVRSAAQEVRWEEAPPTETRPAAAPINAGAGPGAVGVGQSVSEFFRRGFGPAPVSTPAPESRSFVEQIEVILQGQLAALDVPLPHEVHVSAGPDQRLQIQIGRERYGSVDEVPDPQVRALIRAAVAEWERR